MTQELEVVDSSSASKWLAGGGNQRANYKIAPPNSGITHLVAAGLTNPGDAQERRRSIMHWSASNAELGGSNRWIAVLGFRKKIVTAGIVNEGLSANFTIANVNGMKVWIETTVVTTLEAGIVRLSGTELLADGSTSGGATEDITITATTGTVYISTKNWVGTVTVDGDDPGIGNMNVTFDAGNCHGGNHAGMLRVLEAAEMQWNPEETPWRMRWQMRKMMSGTGTTDGFVTVFDRTFLDTDSPSRAQVDQPGIDYHATMTDGFRPELGEGILLRIQVKNIREIQLWVSGYQY